MRKYIIFTAIILCMISCKKEDTDATYTDPYESSYWLLEKASGDEYHIYNVSDTTITVAVKGGTPWFVYSVKTNDTPLSDTKWPKVQAGDSWSPVVKHSFEGDWYRVWRDDMNNINITVWPRTTNTERGRSLYLQLTDNMGGGAFINMGFD